MTKEEAHIDLINLSLSARINIPWNAQALVIFSHGSGSSRFSPRNNYVASILNKHDIATILADLLTRQEDMDYDNRFNISLLSDRLSIVTHWAHQQKNLMELPL